METINLLRIELADEVDSLPEALRSNFPDLAVDFLYTVFKDDLHKPLPRLAPTDLQKALDAVKAAKSSALPAPPFPSDKKLADAKNFTDAIEKEAAELRTSAVPQIVKEFSHLFAFREPAGGDSCEGSISNLRQCERCKKVMFASAQAQHVSLCRPPPPPDRKLSLNTNGALDHQSGSEWQYSSYDNNNMCIKQTGGENKKKRKQPAQSALGLPPHPSKTAKHTTTHGVGQVGHLASIKTSSGIVNTDNHDKNQISAEPHEQIPLSPVLARAAAMRQGRSSKSREPRRTLGFLPDQELKEPLILNTSSVQKKRKNVSPGNHVRLASQNSLELQMRQLHGHRSHGAGTTAPTASTPAASDPAIISNNNNMVFIANNAFTSTINQNNAAISNGNNSHQYASIVGERSMLQNSGASFMTQSGRLLTPEQVQQVVQHLRMIQQQQTLSGSTTPQVSFPHQNNISPYVNRNQTQPTPIVNALSNLHRQQYQQQQWANRLANLTPQQRASLHAAAQLRQQQQQQQQQQQGFYAHSGNPVVQHPQQQQQDGFHGGGLPYGVMQNDNGGGVLLPQQNYHQQHINLLLQQHPNNTNALMYHYNASNR